MGFKFSKKKAQYNIKELKELRLVHTIYKDDTIQINYYFQMACKVASKITDMCQENQLLLYGLYKQSTCGPCLEDVDIGLFDYKKILKQGAWKRFSHMSPKQAKLQYCDIVIYMAENGGFKNIDPDQDKPVQSMGVGYSSR